jgi:hypothetical protein
MAQPFDHFQEDVRALNEYYLYVARDLARRDPDKARIVLGLSNSSLQEIAQMSLEAIRSVSGEVCLVRARWDEATFQRQLKEARSCSVRLESQLHRAARAAREAQS